MRVEIGDRRKGFPVDGNIDHVRTARLHRGVQRIDECLTGFHPARARAAEGLGATARRVETRAALVEALQAAMRASGPYVIDVAIDREAFPPVTNFDAHLARAL